MFCSAVQPTATLATVTSVATSSADTRFVLQAAYQGPLDPGSFGSPEAPPAGVLGQVLEGEVDGTLLLSWLPSQTLMALNPPWCNGATVCWENPLGTDSDFWGLFWLQFNHVQ